MVRRTVRALVSLVLAVSASASLALATSASAQAPAQCPAASGYVHRYAPGAGRTVALTFDDGPGRDTAEMLAILAHFRVTATFFNLGANERTHHSLVRDEHRDGYPIGDHTWDHRDLATLDADGQAGEIDREAREQKAITGDDPCLFRPPYGSFDATTLALTSVRRLQVWNWSVDPEDWKASGSGAQFWVDRIRSRAEAGGGLRHPVILFHNQPVGNPATVAALPSVIRFYQQRGYRFVDVDGRTGHPAIQTLSTREGRTAGGDLVRITGLNLLGTQDVRFGSTRSRPTHVGPNEVLVRAPRHVAGLVDVRIDSVRGVSNPHPSARFRFLAPPSVTGLDTTSGPAVGGERIHLEGTGFEPGMLVRFSSVAATEVHVYGTSSAWLTVPPHAAGTVPVQVTTRWGTSAPIPAATFSYV